MSETSTTTDFPADALVMVSKAGVLAEKILERGNLVGRIAQQPDDEARAALKDQLDDTWEVVAQAARDLSFSASRIGNHGCDEVFASADGVATLQKLVAIGQLAEHAIERESSRRARMNTPVPEPVSDQVDDVDLGPSTD